MRENAGKIGENHQPGLSEVCFCKKFSSEKSSDSGSCRISDAGETGTGMHSRRTDFRDFFSSSRESGLLGEKKKSRVKKKGIFDLRKADPGVFGCLLF